MILIKIIALYLIIGTIIMMIIQPKLDSRFHSMLFSIVGIIIAPVCITWGFMEEFIKTFRKGGKENDQT